MNKTNTPDMREAALGYVLMGLPVFPLCWPNDKGECACGGHHVGDSVGKRPIIEGWTKSAARDAQGVDKLWKGKRRRANIGLPTEGYLAFDVDVGEGKRGLESKAAIEEKYGKLPRTRVHRTGGGGDLWLYLNPGKGRIPNCTNLGGYENIDLKADGGQIVMPPSLHRSGDRYGIIDDYPIAVAPQWMVEMASQSKPAPDTETASEPGSLVQYGMRGDWIFRRMCGYSGKGDTEEAIYQKGKIDYEELCEHDPPMDDKEIRDMARSAFKQETHASREFEPLISLADIEPVALDWLQYPYFPRNKLVSVIGDPGEGKSQLALMIVLETILGDLDLEPANVILATVEDDLDDTVRPRLDVLNATKDMRADLSRIHPITENFILNDEGIALLDYHMGVWHPALLVIDPMSHYLGAKVDIFRSNEIREVMTKLIMLARKHNCCVFLVHHLNKGSSKTIYRALGSIDFVAASRSVLLLGHNEEDINDRAMVHVKGNYAPLGDTRGFSLIGGFHWTGKSDLTPSDLLSSGRKSEKTDIAMEFLRETLGDIPRLAKDLIADGEERGISQRTLEKAKAKLHIQSVRINDKWYWCKKKKAKRLRRPRIITKDGQVDTKPGGKSP